MQQRLRLALKHLRPERHRHIEYELKQMLVVLMTLRQIQRFERLDRERAQAAVERQLNLLDTT